MLTEETAKALIVKYIANKSGIYNETIRSLFIGKTLTRELVIDVLNSLAVKPVTNTPVKKFNKYDNKKFTKYAKPAVKESYKIAMLRKSGLLPNFVNTYLDHGCGSGSISMEIANEINALDVMGIDIYVNPEVKFKVILPNEDSTLPIETGTVDFVTCLLSLHHVPDAKKTIDELCRILSPNGSIIIYEHDADPEDPWFRLYLDAVHLTFVIFGTENENINSTGQKKIDTSDVEWIFSGTTYHDANSWRSYFANNALSSSGVYLQQNSQNMYFEKFAKVGV
jgi:ubiquinone/menaquinone biosynthesis C-methylase UbiE